MKYIVYGAGKYGKIIVEKYKKENFYGYFDREKTGNYCELPILAMDSIDRNIPIIISLQNYKYVPEAYDFLSKAGFRDVYWYTDNPYVDSLDDKIIDISNKGDALLPYVEMHVSDCCNLRCKGCTHFSPLFHKINADLTSAMKDVKVLADKVSYILQFRILGGEPFLNRNLGYYVQGVRDLLPDTRIFVVTNGMLIPKVQSDVLERIRTCQAVVNISNYLPTKKIMPQIENRLRKAGVKYNISSWDSKTIFNKPLSINVDGKYPHKCISDGCVNIYHGKIARCPTLMYVSKFNQVFGTNLPEDGIINLHDKLFGKELLDRLREPVPLCKHCVENEIQWETCGLVPTLDDFASI